MDQTLTGQTVVLNVGKFNKVQTTQNYDYMALALED